MKKNTLTYITVLALMLAGCSVSENEQTNVDEGNISENTQDQSGNSFENLQSTSEYSNIEISSELLESATTLNEKEVVINKSGVYELSGNYENVTVNVNPSEDTGAVYLVLNNATIESENSTPINVVSASNVAIYLADQTQNSVTQGAMSDTDAAIVSNTHTVIAGTGNLTVTSPVGDGISSSTELIIESGTIDVNAADHGIVAHDFMALNTPTITIDSGKDGLRTSNDEDDELGKMVILGASLDITAEGDAVSAENTIQINDGQFTLRSGDGFVEVLNEITVGEGSNGVVHATDLLETSMKGLKGADIIINNGTFEFSAYEDGIHANGDLTINGGSFTVLAGDDAVHADDNLVINDGTIIVEDGYEGIEGSTITINGGNITVNVLDDAVNAGDENGFIHILDGSIRLTSSGDGLDSNGDLTIEGGNIVITSNALYPGGDGAIDVSGEYVITGGSVTDEFGNELELLEGRFPGGNSKFPPR